MTSEGVRILLEFLNIRRAAYLFAHVLHSAEPFVLVITQIHNVFVDLKHIGSKLRCGVAAKVVARHEGLVKHVTDIVGNIAPFCNILTRLFVFTVYIQNRFCAILILLIKSGKLFVVFFCPLIGKRIHLIAVHL